MTHDPAPQIFGIRHHGPGSARSLLAALERMSPDCLLVEGPPDADELLSLLPHAQMEPPVAILVYVPDEPRRAVYFPFALFSPEWQALRYGLGRGIAVRFFDLPQRYQLAMDAAPSPQTADDLLPRADRVSADGRTAPEPAQPSPRQDPLGTLARAAGYTDGERWWERVVEQRRDGADLFAEIADAMAALRAESPPETDATELRREAHMRQQIRRAKADGHRRIAVVCGAWHAPALRETADAKAVAKADAALLKRMPSVDVAATWVPWTASRLAYRSGYGAGVESPGWYAHLWRAAAAGHGSREISIRWLARVATLLRENSLDASSASVIEAVRLAETLAAIDGRQLPGLDDLNDAAQATFCFGAAAPLQLIHERLVVGDDLGGVPDETPLAPLQRDLQREQRRLRLPAAAAWKDYDLDLRAPNDRERSLLLHRLKLLEVPWGQLQRSGGGKGTFHEIWRLEWRPELAVALIEAGIWGTTIAAAASLRARRLAEVADLSGLTGLTETALLAELTDAVPRILERLQEEAALAADGALLMDALPPLANLSRYGSVRQTDAAAVASVTEGIAARVCIGLPLACAALDDAAADAMYDRVLATDRAMDLLHQPQQLAAWHAALRKTIDIAGVHGLIAGRACALLLSAGGLTPGAVADRVSLALSRAANPTEAAAWVEGLLRDGGATLVHDATLLAIVDGWVVSIADDQFAATLPLIRRTFSTFSAPERRMIGERVRHGAAQRPAGTVQPIDAERAARVIPLLEQIFGLSQSS